MWAPWRAAAHHEHGEAEGKERERTRQRHGLHYQHAAIEREAQARREARIDDVEAIADEMNIAG
jgi:hypothetical protein